MILVKERENEQKLLILYLKEKNTILIKGVPGSGKTHTVLKTLELLNINDYQYFNCAYKQLKLSDIKVDNPIPENKINKTAKVKKKKLLKINIFNKKIKKDKTSEPISININDVNNDINNNVNNNINNDVNKDNNNNYSGIIIIDEVDMLKNKLILYQLMAERTLILISNTLTLSTKLASRVTKIINFLPYTGSQMVNILGKDDISIRRIVTGDLRRAKSYIKKLEENIENSDLSMFNYELNDFQKCKNYSEYASLSRMKGMIPLDYYEFLDGRDVVKNLNLDS
ncbi:Origin recognition complex subunit 1 [Dictyocoela muelleri]|nr:Origin recognition complex subunit 1 [Dictyocoela muelleri]